MPRAAGRGGPAPMANFRALPLRPARYRIYGTTRDATGDVLPGCEVLVYDSDSLVLKAETVSDGNGNYTVDVNGPETGARYFAYASFGGNRAGCTIDTLAGEFA